VRSGRCSLYPRGRHARAQTWAAASRATDRPLIQYRLKGDLLISFTTRQHHSDRPPVALGTQAQLGREPVLAAAKSLPRLGFFGRGPIAASTGGVLTGETGRWAQVVALALANCPSSRENAGQS
jgi:hypothetical protein